MSGIKKINKIENLGLFENSSWPEGELFFKKINMLYGYNGSGKTTLSNILSLFSEEHDDLSRKKVLDSLRSDNTRQHKIEIEWDGKKIKSFNDAKKIHVFNSAFITSHVYNGTKSKPLSFKGNIVTEEQLSNPIINSLTEKIDEIKGKQTNVTDQLDLLEKLATSIRKDLSKQWNDNIEGSRMPSDLKLEKCPQTQPQKAYAVLEKKLDEQFEKFKISKDQSALLTDIELLKSLHYGALEQPKKVLDDISGFVTDTVKEKVRELIEKHKDASLKHATVQNWYEDGKSLLEHSIDHKACPLCSSELPDIQDLIKSYNDFFSDDLAILLTALQGHIETYRKIIQQVEAGQAVVTNTNALISKYEYQKHLSPEEVQVVQTLALGEVKKSLQQCEAIVQAKKDDVSKVVSGEEISALEKCLSELSDYGDKIDVFSKIKKKFREKLQSSLFDTSVAKNTCKDLFWAKFNNDGAGIADVFRTEKNVQKPEQQGGIEFYQFLKKTESILQTHLVKNESDRNQELAKLKQESAYVNQFLSDLRITHFEISEVGDDIAINYIGKHPKKGIHYTLSEGEKTALAFAYFLSKFQYEILDNQDQNVTPSDHIIVVDDPISSLDENRLFSTALLIQSILLPKAVKTDTLEDKDGNKKKFVKSWQGCKQIFIFSHNLIFLKFMNNLIDSNQNLDRADFYLEKGQLSELPSSLRNYQTSYFYKLSKVQDFSEGVLDYEEVKDFLPNYIRICLETFISFKFARLRQGASSDKYRPAMLDKLISGVKGEDFSSFRAVGNIKSKDDLIATLQEIKNKVNPECHGTSQEITHLEYLSKTELQELAGQLMNVFEYLDQLHFNKVKKLKAVA